MVAMFEIVFLIVCVVLGVRWLTRTNIYRGLRRSGVDPGQYGVGGAQGRFYGVGGPQAGPERRSPHTSEQPDE